MQPKNRYQAGAGYGTDTGPRLTLGYRNRYLNRHGHSVYADLRFSLIQTRLDALYAIPLKRPDKDELGFAAQIGTQDTLAGTAEISRIGVRHSTGRWWLREILSLDLQRERFNVGEGPQTSVLLLPSAAYTWLSTENVLNPERGARVDLIGTGAWKDLLSDVSFFSLRLNGKGIYSLGERNRVIARTQLGYIGTDRFRELPLTQRFYAGGDKSVRGYRLNEISARNADGDRIGGRYLTIGSLEYERMLFGPWGVAVFYDVGRAANRLDEPFSHGVGLGARWRSPIGPVRLVSPCRCQAEDSFQIHLIHRAGSMRRVLAVALAGFLVLVVFGQVLLMTEIGLNWLVRGMEHRFDQLSIGRAAGSVLGGFRCGTYVIGINWSVEVGISAQWRRRCFEALRLDAVL